MPVPDHAGAMNRIVGLRGNVLRQQHALDIIPLTPDSPFGNLQLKQAHVIDRLVHANRRLDEAETQWDNFHSSLISVSAGAGVHHRFSADEVTFHLRRAMDDLIALVWLLHERNARADWPERLLVDSIGRAQSKDGSWRLELLEQHGWLASTLNAVSNAHKHSFVDSDFQVVGGREPCVVALALKNNDRREQATPYVVSLDSLVVAFNSFLIDAMDELRVLQPTAGP